jgi:hypothetical protein
MSAMFVGFGDIKRKRFEAGKHINFFLDFKGPEIFQRTSNICYDSVSAVLHSKLHSRPDVLEDGTCLILARPGDLIRGLNETQLRRWDTSSPWYRTFHGRFPFDWQFSAQQPYLVVQRRRETREISGCIDDLCPPGSKIKSYFLRVYFFRQNVWRGGACCGSSVGHTSLSTYTAMYLSGRPILNAEVANI